ncbi:MAG: NADH-quinone oxidoreductase subunit H [Candidatus Methanomethylophilaceae archaeon]|nr:NADH-quinone oxidoreductase subunit H [Candidatus Methanomethylophilaceae archaeon]
MNVEVAIVTILQALVMVAISPLMAGIIRKMKALMQGKVGPSIIQPYRDLRKLMRKGRVAGKSHTWLFSAVPYLCLSSMLILALMVPFVYVEVASPYIDLITMVYLFTLFRFAMVLGGLEGGSVFGGMGSSREMMMSVLIEPALLLSIMSMVALTGGSTGISNIPDVLCEMGLAAVGPTLILATTSFMITLLAENARVPFDNPATHLELTMVHEAMVLEYSGRKLGMMELASQIRLTLFMVMVGTLFLPWGIATEFTLPALVVATVAIVAKLLIIAAVIAIVECTVAKLRLFKTPNLLTISFTLSLLAMISIYIL